MENANQPQNKGKKVTELTVILSSVHVYMFCNLMLLIKFLRTKFWNLLCFQFIQNVFLHYWYSINYREETSLGQGIRKKKKNVMQQDTDMVFLQKRYSLMMQRISLDDSVFYLDIRYVFKDIYLTQRTIIFSKLIYTYVSFLLQIF